MANHTCRSETAEDVPLLEERVSVMKEAGRVLMEYFDGRFANAVHSAKGSARALLRIIVSHFSSYNDSVIYHNHKSKYPPFPFLLALYLLGLFYGSDYVLLIIIPYSSHVLQAGTNIDSGLMGLLPWSRLGRVQRHRHNNNVC